MSEDLKGYLQKLIFILPALFLIGLFIGYPFIASIYYSFTDWDGVSTANFIGLKNYVDLFKDTSFLSALKNTALFTIGTLLLVNPLSLMLAVILNSRIKGSTALRTIFYLPAIISQIVVSTIWIIILTYDGIFNKLLETMGLGKYIVDWMGDYDKAPWVVVAIIIWQCLGSNAIFYVAGLQGISKELYEAADIDGASALSKFTRITFPLLMPAITVVTFLQLTFAIKLFDIPFIMTNGGPGDVTTTVTMLIYKQAFTYSTAGYASTTGIILLLITIVASVFQLKVTRSREVEL